MRRCQRRSFLTGTKRILQGESVGEGVGGGELIEGRGQKMEWSWESAGRGWKWTSRVTTAQRRGALTMSGSGHRIWDSWLCSLSRFTGRDSWLGSLRDFAG